MHGVWLGSASLGWLSGVVVWFTAEFSALTSFPSEADTIPVLPWTWMLLVPRVTGCAACQARLAETVTTTRKESPGSRVHLVVGGLLFPHLILLLYSLRLMVRLRPAGKDGRVAHGHKRLAGAILRRAWLPGCPIHLSRLCLVPDALLACGGNFRGAECCVSCQFIRLDVCIYSADFFLFFLPTLGTYHSWTFYIFWLWMAVTDDQNSVITIYKSPVYFSLVLVTKHWESWFT